MHDCTRDYCQPGPCPDTQSVGPNSAGRLVTRLELELAVAAVNLEAKAIRLNREFREGRS